MINIPNATLLGLNHSFQFWGEVHNYRNIQEYSIQAKIDGSLGVERIAPVWSGISGFSNLVTGNVYPITINNTFLGSGRITEFSAEEGVDTRDKNYNLTFQIFKTGNISVNGIKDLKFVNDFTTTAEYTRDKFNIYSYSRNASLQYDKSYSGEGAALQEILSYVNPVPNLSQYFSDIPNYYQSAGLIKNTTQRFDRINGRIDYSESFQIQPGQNYTLEYEHSLNTDENGISSVSERGTIQSLVYDISGERLAAAEVAWNSIYPNSFYRINDFYGRWIDTGHSALVNFPVTKSVQKDRNKGLLTYDISYTNDVSQKSGLSFSYENSIERGQNGYISVSENGNIQSSVGNFDSVWSYYSGVKTGIRARNQIFYNQSRPFFIDCSGSGFIKEISSDETYRERQAAISYDFSYTDDPTYYSSGPFKRISTRISDSKPVHIVNMFGVVNHEEVAQPALQNTPGTYSVAVEIIGTGQMPVETYLNAALQKVSTPTGAYNYYKSEENYSLSPLNNSFSYNVDYTYSLYRDFSVNTV